MYYVKKQPPFFTKFTKTYDKKENFIVQKRQRTYKALDIININENLKP